MKGILFGALAFVVGTGVSLPSPVADAAMKGDVAAVRSLIAKGANVNAAQGDGMTALHWAAERGDSAMADVLLRAKANVRARTRIGDYTPLHIAARGGQAAVVRVLLAAGSDANAPTSSGASALHFAAAAGDPGAVKALVDKRADVNAREKEWGQTPLVFAAAAGRAEAIRVLIKAGADPSIHTTAVNLTEQAAQEQAATKKRNEILVSFEPEKHRDTAKAPTVTAAGTAGSTAAAPPVPGRPGVPQPRGPFTPTQIQQAIDSGRVVLVSPLAVKGPVQEEVDTINGGVAGFLTSVGGMGGLTALHHAVRQGNLDAVVALLDGGADINDPTTSDKTTPLLMATVNGQFDVAMKLIERGADPNLASVAGNTPLYAVINTQWAPRSRFPQPQAVQFQRTTYLEVMEALLQAKAQPNVRITQHLWYFAYNNCGSGNCGLENLEGTTPFWRAAYAVDVDAMRLLVKYGADPNIPSQRTPQQQVARAAGAGGGAGAAGAAGAASGVGGGAGGGGGGGGGGGRGNQPPPVAATPEIDSAGKAMPPGIGVYPIHAAAGVGYGNGFAGNSHRHAPEGWMPAMKYLVEELHADVNQRDAQGMTPLHHAASRGDNEMILYLVSKGADVRAVSRNFRTTVDMANGPVQRLRPFPETIALLEKLGAKNSHRCVSC
ncbi:MAG TPA: ankyrin repeat domain-containing protein [Gemmatimonadaceae bacterium]|nr:ankyrin repeat domain-containing protein [Gemmatimonadaceae bacterium]